jgi:fumarate hydratase subunit beta
MSDAELRITTPLTCEAVRNLHAGDRVLLTGPLYTGRDAAHRRLVDLLEVGEELPVELRGQLIYYCGPAPAAPGHAMGSAGPTTSYRMDPYTPRLHELGLAGSIGKGERGIEVREACRKLCAVYLVAIGGAGALLSRSVESARVVAYEDLGPEAIRLLQVRDFPAMVAYDCHGRSVFPGDEPL